MDNLLLLQKILVERLKWWRSQDEINELNKTLSDVAEVIAFR